MKALLVTAACTLAMLAAAAAAAPYGQNQGFGGQGFGGQGNGPWPDRNGGNWNGGKWDTIGQKTVNSGYDRDHLKVRGDDRYRKLRVCSLDRPIELNGLSIEFHNGERQDFSVRKVLHRGDCTKALDLDGRRRNMDDVWLTYSKLRRGGEPRVVIQAR